MSATLPTNLSGGIVHSILPPQTESNFDVPEHFWSDADHADLKFQIEGLCQVLKINKHHFPAFCKSLFNLATPLKWIFEKYNREITPEKHREIVVVFALHELIRCAQRVLQDPPLSTPEYFKDFATAISDKKEEIRAADLSLFTDPETATDKKAVSSEKTIEQIIGSTVAHFSIESDWKEQYQKITENEMLFIQARDADGQVVSFCVNKEELRALSSGNICDTLRTTDITSIEQRFQRLTIETCYLFDDITLIDDPVKMGDIISDLNKIDVTNDTFWEVSQDNVFDPINDSVNALAEALSVDKATLRRAISKDINQLSVGTAIFSAMKIQKKLTGRDHDAQFTLENLPRTRYQIAEILLETVNEIPALFFKKDQIDQTKLPHLYKAILPHLTTAILPKIATIRAHINRFIQAEYPGTTNVFLDKRMGESAPIHLKASILDHLNTDAVSGSWAIYLKTANSVFPMAVAIGKIPTNQKLFTLTFEYNGENTVLECDSPEECLNMIFYYFGEDIQLLKLKQFHVGNPVSYISNLWHLFYQPIATLSSWISWALTPSPNPMPFGDFRKAVLGKIGENIDPLKQLPHRSVSDTILRAAQKRGLDINSPLIEEVSKSPQLYDHAPLCTEDHLEDFNPKTEFTSSITSILGDPTAAIQALRHKHQRFGFAWETWKHQTANTSIASDRYCCLDRSPDNHPIFAGKAENIAKREALVHLRTLLEITYRIYLNDPFVVQHKEFWVWIEHVPFAKQLERDENGKYLFDEHQSLQIELIPTLLKEIDRELYGEVESMECSFSGFEQLGGFIDGMEPGSLYLEMSRLPTSKFAEIEHGGNFSDTEEAALHQRVPVVISRNEAGNLSLFDYEANALIFPKIPVVFVLKDEAIKDAQQVSKSETQSHFLTFENPVDLISCLSTELADDLPDRLPNQDDEITTKTSSLHNTSDQVEPEVSDSNPKIDETQKPKLTMFKQMISRISQNDFARLFAIMRADSLVTATDLTVEDAKGKYGLLMLARKHYNISQRAVNAYNDKNILAQVRGEKKQESSRNSNSADDSLDEINDNPSADTHMTEAFNDPTALIEYLKNMHGNLIVKRAYFKGAESGMTRSNENPIDESALYFQEYD